MTIKLELRETVSEGVECRLIYDVPLIHQQAARSLAKHGSMNLDGVVDYEWVINLPESAMQFAAYIPMESVGLEGNEFLRVPPYGDLKRIKEQITARLEEEDRELQKAKARQEVMNGS